MDEGGGPVDPLPTPQTAEIDIAPEQRRLAHVEEACPHPLDVVIPGLTNRVPAAYNQLYDLMADRLFAFAYRKLSDRHEAEDAVQQAFLELAQAAAVPVRGRSLEAWLFTSVRFTCIDMTRQRVRRPVIPCHPVPEGDHEDQYDMGLDPVLEGALSSLTDQQRLVLHLKHVEGIDGEQIAEILGVTRMAVYATAARGERRMRQLLAGTANPLSPFQPVDHG